MFMYECLSCYRVKQNVNTNLMLLSQKIHEAMVLLTGTRRKGRCTRTSQQEVVLTDGTTGYLR